MKKVMYENLSINEGNIKTELKKETWWKSVAGIHLSWASGSTFNRGNESLDSIKRRKFLVQLINC